MRPAGAPLHHHEAVDELTRLARAAGAGDRYALASFVRLSHDEVHRLCAAQGLIQLLAVVIDLGGVHDGVPYSLMQMFLSSV